jgi:thiamine biosynthesis lipoprotein
MTVARPAGGEVIFRYAERVMGTVVSFDVRPRGLAYPLTQDALAKARRILHRADEMFSLYQPGSPLSRLRRGELEVEQCPPEVSEVLGLCEQARELSGGWFDPWAMPGGVDPTGLVKGWAAQQAADALQRAGLAAGMVNAAGDIATFGQPSSLRRWRVGIRCPTTPDRLLCTVTGDGAVATSGTYERGDHILDPRSGGPARDAVSATVCGPDLSLADALATGLLAAGVRGLAAVSEAGYEALLVAPDGSWEATAAFPLE